MPNKIFSVFLTKDDLPFTGTAPTIDIWELDPDDNTINTLIVNAAVMVEVGGGHYRYDLATYDFTKNYVFTADAGITADQQWHYGGNESYSEDISFQTWEQMTADHLVTGTFGFLQSQMGADAQALRIDLTTVLSIVNLLLDHAEARTVIDKIAMTLTIYAPDKVTPLVVFDLKDSNGNPSIIEVCERDPV